VFLSSERCIGFLEPTSVVVEPASDVAVRLTEMVVPPEAISFELSCERNFWVPLVSDPMRFEAACCWVSAEKVCPRVALGAGQLSGALADDYRPMDTPTAVDRSSALEAEEPLGPQIGSNILN